MKKDNLNISDWFKKVISSEKITSGVARFQLLLNYFSLLTIATGIIFFIIGLGEYGLIIITPGFAGLVFKYFIGYIFSEFKKIADLKDENLVIETIKWNESIAIISLLVGLSSVYYSFIYLPEHQEQQEAKRTIQLTNCLQLAIDNQIKMITKDLKMEKMEDADEHLKKIYDEDLSKRNDELRNKIYEQDRQDCFNFYSTQ